MLFESEPLQTNAVLGSANAIIAKAICAPFNQRVENINSGKNLIPSWMEAG
jgi:hypothetical protein